VQRLHKIISATSFKNAITAHLPLNELFQVLSHLLHRWPWCKVL